MAEWFRVLDLQPGADMAQIKSSYRQLMRKYMEKNMSAQMGPEAIDTHVDAVASRCLPIEPRRGTTEP